MVPSVGKVPQGSCGTFFRSGDTPTPYGTLWPSQRCSRQMHVVETCRDAGQGRGRVRSGSLRRGRGCRRCSTTNCWRRQRFSAIGIAFGLKIAPMAKTSNRNTCTPAAIIPARAPRRRPINAKPSGSSGSVFAPHKTTGGALRLGDRIGAGATGRGLYGLSPCAGARRGTGATCLPLEGGRCPEVDPDGGLLSALA